MLPLIYELFVNPDEDEAIPKANFILLFQRASMTQSPSQGWVGYHLFC